jgi:OOP family OmpA-OmpF porin
LGYNIYFYDGDGLDGTIAGVTQNDKFGYLYTGLEFSLGAKTKPNLDWVNPIALMYDELKDPSLRKELDALKQRVSTLEAADLLKDSDGDGVADKLDKCPNTEAGVKVDGGGCPLDTDNDGVPDSKDSCPTEKGTAEFNGCPGSPSSTANAIQFEFNSSVLKTSSYPVLDQLSNDLRSKVILKVELGGHASEEGTPDYNLQLSKDRANAVKTYLVNSGVAASKIVTKGFGETRPVASNTTEEGRQLNRRVEIVK